MGLLQVEGLQPTSAYQITDMLLLSTISEPPLKQLISVLGGSEKKISIEISGALYITCITYITFMLATPSMTRT